MLRRGLVLLTSAVLCSSLGCKPSDPSPVPSPGPTDSGTVPTLAGALKAGPGKQVPANARAVVLWAGEEEIYKYGEGLSTGATYSLDVPASLPAELLNAKTVGVGIVALVPTGTPLAEGRNDVDIIDSVIGVAEDFAFIYRPGGPQEDLSYREWIKYFPIGLSCARGVETDGIFDAFRPVPCESIPITVDDLDNLNLVNWT